MLRTCATCGTEFSRPDNAAWRTAKYCSLRCSGIGSHRRKPDDEFKARYRKVKTPDGRNMLEHRWVMEQVIGRPLLRSEQVHHINRDRLDNRIENLELVTVAEHAERHTLLPTTKTCEWCGDEFTPHKTKRRRAKTCCPEHGRLLAGRIRGPDRRGRERPMAGRWDSPSLGSDSSHPGHRRPSSRSRSSADLGESARGGPWHVRDPQQAVP